MRPLVWFTAAERPYAVDVAAVREIRSAAAVDDLPDARADVAGAIDVDGDIVPVLTSLGGGGKHVIVLLGPRGRAFGLLVDRVTAVRPVDEAAVGPAPQGQRSALVQGVVRGGERPVSVLDVTALSSLAAG